MVGKAKGEKAGESQPAAWRRAAVVPEKVLCLMDMYEYKSTYKLISIKSINKRVQRGRVIAGVGEMQKRLLHAD